MLGFRAKRFGEQFHHMQQRRRSASKSLLKNSNGSLTGLDEDQPTDSNQNNPVVFDLGVTRNSESENDECNTIF